jgi:phage terminase large subunit-like protein
VSEEFDLTQLSEEQLEQLHSVVTSINENRADHYVPNPKQKRWHEAGSVYEQRLMMAGNQLGKSHGAAFESRCHITGKYPKWWQGKRFTHATRGWIAGRTAETTRDIMQRKLLGPINQPGTGFLAADDIIRFTKKRNVAEAVDQIFVRHNSGGTSEVGFKSYDQGVGKFEGPDLDFICVDEEPPYDVFEECLARLTATNGIIYVTFTPLRGKSQVVSLFWPKVMGPDRYLVRMGLKDATHLTDEQRARALARYPVHQRRARLEGLPILGEGLVFDGIDIDSLIVEPFEIPKWWKVLTGLDIGMGNHPTCAAWTAWDPQTGCGYLYHEYMNTSPEISAHAAALGSRIPVSWPRDGHKQTHENVEIVDIYRRYGARMLYTHASLNGSLLLEPQVTEMRELMQTGKWKVFRTAFHWISEFSSYYRKADRDGNTVIEAKEDDMLSASRYAIIMRENARPVKNFGRQRTRVVGLDYDPLNNRAAQRSATLDEDW